MVVVVHEPVDWHQLAHARSIAHGDEAARAGAVVDRMCAEACALGGTVTAEHGIGKVKRDYAKYRFGDWQIAAMKAVKTVFDPAGIMAPGNIWDED